MIGYKDRQFCVAPCLTTDCPRNLTDEVRAAAVRWWGSDDAPIWVADMRDGCPDYSPEPAAARRPLDLAE